MFDKYNMIHRVINYTVYIQPKTYSALFQLIINSISSVLGSYWIKHGVVITTFHMNEIAV